MHLTRNKLFSLLKTIIKHKIYDDIEIINSGLTPCVHSNVFQDEIILVFAERGFREKHLSV